MAISEKKLKALPADQRMLVDNLVTAAGEAVQREISSHCFEHDIEVGESGAVLAHGAVELTLTVRMCPADAMKSDLLNYHDNLLEAVNAIDNMAGLDLETLRKF